MENYYLFIVGILFLLAISDLIVGVSNDAVNFLNSAIGSKVASFKLIIFIAGLGVLFGSAFSEGMMEVARKGIFNPSSFTFSEVMIIFLAVMFSDVILLDLFNTFGLPTSTTVSIVFELLGASVCMALIKIGHSEYTIADLGKFINAGKSLFIITGILSSVVISFIFGLIIQYISRIIFTFNLKSTLKFFGSIFGGLCSSLITYFLIIIGCKHSILFNEQQINFIISNQLEILFIFFLVSTIILQLLSLLKINPLKTVVLYGTFALAMAFAGNDLVNFIGVPIAGFVSYKYYLTQNINPDDLYMTFLSGKVATPKLILILSGLIMTVVMFVSKKARTVVNTSLKLSHQDETLERFESSAFARILVRNWISLSKKIDNLIPSSIKKFLKKRFNQKHFKKYLKNNPGASFDLIRASVNLTVASSLIAFATFLKLPLSTTYVTFMVAMGTSLADNAWGRESAVYRITGVITVILGWFVTALFAFTFAFVFAIFLFYGKSIALIITIAFVTFFVIKTHAIHKKREEQNKTEQILSFENITTSTIIEKCIFTLNTTLFTTYRLYKETIESLVYEKRKKLKHLVDESNNFNKEVKNLKNQIHNTVKLFKEESEEAGDYYVQVIDYLREIAHCIEFIVKPAYNHVDNNHSPFVQEQIEDILNFAGKLKNFFDEANLIISKNAYKMLPHFIDHSNQLLEELNKMRKRHIKLLKTKNIPTRASMLYLDIIIETKNLILYVVNLIKSQRDLVVSNKSFEIF